MAASTSSLEGAAETAERGATMAVTTRTAAAVSRVILVRVSVIVLLGNGVGG